MSQELLTTQENTQEQEEKQNTQAKKENKAPKQLLVNCKKFQYLGIEPYRFKDIYGKPYIAYPNQILIVPNDSLARHFKYKKLYFKEV